MSGPRLLHVHVHKIKVVNFPCFHAAGRNPLLTSDELNTQVAKMWAAFADQNSLMGSLFVGGTKYMVIAGDAGAVLRGKKQQSGIVIKKTNTAMVIGLFDEGAQPGDCNIVVENLGDYLAGQGI